MVATLCGCNRDDDNSKTNNTSESISINNDYESDGDLSAETKALDIDNKDSASKNKFDTQSDAHSKNSALTEQNNTTSKKDNENKKQNKNENSASSSPPSDEVHEAEIDFSELE
jgi:hypothetical protein